MSIDVITHGSWCGTLVFPVNCRRCGERIFFFSCDHGSKILFDELGPPWPIHACGAVSGSSKAPPRPSGRIAWDTLKGVKTYHVDPRTDGLLPGFARGNDSVDTRLAQSARQIRYQPRETVRVEAAGAVRAERVAGWIQSVGPPNTGREVLTSDIVWSHIRQEVGSSEVIQATLLSDVRSEDPALLDLESYTFWIEKSVALRIGLAVGQIVEARLSPAVIISLGSRWVCKSIEIVN